MKRFIQAVDGVLATLSDGTEVATSTYAGCEIKRTRYDKAEDRIHVFVAPARSRPRIELVMTTEDYRRVLLLTRLKEQACEPDRRQR